MKIFRYVTGITISAAMMTLGTQAFATVVSLDAAGNVEVKEAKDFRYRKDEAPSVTPAADNVTAMADIETDPAPVIARIIPAAINPEPSEIDLSVNLDGAALEVFPRTELKALRPETEAIPVEDIAKKTHPYSAFIAAEAAKYEQVDVALIEAVIEAESNYNPTAVSPKGAMGLMQLMPATAERYGVINAFNPAENIRAGTAELARLMDIYDNPTLALAAYNAGQGAVEKHDGVPPYKETQGYVVKVLSKTFTKREDDQKSKPSEPTELVAVKSDSVENRPMKVYSFDW